MQLLPFSHTLNIRSRGYLPHWEIDNAIYFITYRLADSLPKDVMRSLEREHDSLKRQIGDTTAVQRALVRRTHLRRINAYLDNGIGDCSLRNPEIAKTV